MCSFSQHPLVLSSAFLKAAERTKNGTRSHKKDVPTPRPAVSRTTDIFEVTPASISHTTLQRYVSSSRDSKNLLSKLSSKVDLTGCEVLYAISDPLILQACRIAHKRISCPIPSINSHIQNQLCRTFQRVKLVSATLSPFTYYLLEPDN